MVLPVPTGFRGEVRKAAVEALSAFADGGAEDLPAYAKEVRPAKKVCSIRRWF